MRSWNRILCSWSFGLSWVLLTGLGHAQEAGTTAPALVTPGPLELPEDRPAAGGSVLFELVVSEDGSVTEAIVVEGITPTVDDAARAALFQSRFQPATADGKAVASRFRFRFPVAPKEPEPPPAAPEVEASAAGSEGGAAGAEVAPSQAVAAEAVASSDAATAPSGETAPAAGAQAEAAPAEELASFEGTAEVEAPPREAAKRTVTKEELTRVPGTRGDALRAIEVLPGVGHSSMFQGDPIIRGSAPGDSVSYINGVPVPLLYHFGGVTSVFQSSLIEQVDLYPGNFSSRYGRATGGVVEATARAPRMDRVHGRAELGTLDASAVVEAPIAKDTSIAFGARRSHIDYLFEKLVEDSGFRSTVAPRYWDYQGMLHKDVSESEELQLLAFGSSDSFELLFDEADDADPGVRGTIGAAIRYHRLQGGWNKRLSKLVTQKLTVTGGYTAMDQSYGEYAATFTSWEGYSRGEWTLSPSDRFQLHGGFDLDVQRLTGEYFGPAARQEEGGGPSGGLGTQGSIYVSDTILIARPGAYAEVEARPLDSLLLVPGVRADFDNMNQKWTVDPRFSFREELGGGAALRGGVGLYSQAPAYHKILKGVGNPELEPVHSAHYGIGWVQQWGGGLETTVDGFYKQLWNRDVSTEGSVEPYFTNDGKGRIIGLELGSQWRPDASTVAFFAYTLSRSERQDRSDPWRLMDQDQTHNFSLAALRRLGRGWEVGGRFRYVTGNPETPVTGGIYGATTDLYVPRTGALYSERLPPFYQLDLRVEKAWEVSENGRVAVFLDLQNALNTKQVVEQAYSYDYRAKEEVTGLPIIPNLGVRGEL